MAQQQRKEQRRKQKQDTLPFTKTNYMILGAGLLTIVLGYIALDQGPWDGFMPLVVAPILLVVGYCVIVPLGILYRKRTEVPNGGEELAQQEG